MLVEDHNQLTLTTSNEPTNNNEPTSLNYAATSTGSCVTERTASMCTDARSVVGPTRPRAAWQEGSPALVKPPPWTPLRPFILECELSNYPDKVFVRQLIDNLRQGCTIGYTVPQFTYVALNLQSASQ